MAELRILETERKLPGADTFAMVQMMINKYSLHLNIKDTSFSTQQGGFLPDEAPTFKTMAARTDSELFGAIISNQHHVLRTLCRLRSAPPSYITCAHDSINLSFRLVTFGTFYPA